MEHSIVTGGEGFIGGRIVQETGGESYDLKSGLDILNSGDLQRALLNSEKDFTEITGIFHCAALISVPESMQKPDDYYRTNVEGTKHVVQAAESVGAKIVFSSSAAVYGEATKALKETADLNPKSPYAENKRDGEEVLRQSSMPHIALRYFNVYGPGQSPQYAGVITAFILNALKGNDVLIYGDGTQVRDFIYIDDIVLANIAAMKFANTSFEIFNIANGKETTIEELAKMIIKITNSTSKIVYKPAREGDIVYSQADVSKAKSVLRWEAKVSLEEGLKKTVEYYRQQLIRTHF